MRQVLADGRWKRLWGAGNRYPYDQDGPIPPTAPLRGARLSFPDSTATTIRRVLAEEGLVTKSVSERPAPCCDVHVRSTCQHDVMSVNARQQLLAQGRALERVTLGWNVVGIIVLTIAAVSARSVALAGFGLDSLIEIGASTVVLWELAAVAETRQQRAMRLIGGAFVALALYLAVQSTVVLVVGFHPHHSVLGIVWTAVTAVAMFLLAAGKAKTGAALDNPVLRTEGRVTLIDGMLASAVMLGLVFNAALSWWWADPAAGYVLVYYGAREAREALVR